MRGAVLVVLLAGCAAAPGGWVVHEAEVSTEPSPKQVGSAAWRCAPPQDRPFSSFTAVLYNQRAAPGDLEAVQFAFEVDDGAWIRPLWRDPAVGVVGPGGQMDVQAIACVQSLRQVHVLAGSWDDIEGARTIASFAP